LLGYLTRQEKRTLATNIHDLLTHYSGIWITPDVGTQQLFKRFSQVEEDVQQQIENISSATGRDIEKNAFEDDDDLRRFFTDAGYTIEEYPHANVLEDLSAVKLTQLNRGEVRELMQVRRTLILTPQVGRDYSKITSTEEVKRVNEGVGHSPISGFVQT
jgi:hypothetical protein